MFLPRYTTVLFPLHSVGKDVGDIGGDGPGSFNVQGNVWHPRLL